MKATMDIAAKLLDNDDLFNNEFYNRFELRHADEPLQLSNKISKNYRFPTFYGDVTCAIAIFLCSYEKAEKLVAQELHPDIKPVKATKGRSIIAFSCYEYKNVMGVAPYNEIAMAIPVMVNTKFRPPLLPMVMSSFSRFGYYIAGMPVTSYENQLRGNKIWGLPKVTQDIDITRSGNDCISTAYEESGEPYLTLTVPMEGTPTDFDVTSNLYSRLDGKLLQNETNFKANFKVKKYMNMLTKKGVKPDRTYIKIGNTASGKMLQDLEIEEHPFQFRYAENMSSCFDLPNKEVPKWVEELNK
ncbi:MAG: acetoacetate decarboxylase family protein [bacterium]|nr:acetoacetate decarboxylase family protein [bacterium]